MAGPRAGVAARPICQVPAVLREIALPGAAAVVRVPVADPPAQGGCTVLLLRQGCLEPQAGGLGLERTSPVGWQHLPARRGVGMLLAQQARGQRGRVATGEQGGGWPVGHVVDGAKIQLGELRRVEERVAMGWLRRKAPEVPLRIRVWEVVKGMSRVLAEKVESPSRLHVLRCQPGASGHGLVHRVSGKNIEHAKRTRVVLLQPGVNTLPVKLMGARDDPQFLALAELLQANGADRG